MCLECRRRNLARKWKENPAWEIRSKLLVVQKYLRDRDREALERALKGNGNRIFRVLTVDTVTGEGFCCSDEGRRVAFKRPPPITFKDHKCETSS